MTSRPTTLWTCGFLTGAAFGLATGVLAAPRSGKRTRRLIRRQAEEAEDRVAEATEQALDRGREVIDHSRRYVDETVRGLSDKVRSAVTT